MAETTQIHPAKLRAYLATDYRLGHTSQDIVLTIGQRSERLAALFAGSGVNCGAFLTAYDPQGSARPTRPTTKDTLNLAASYKHWDCKSLKAPAAKLAPIGPLRKAILLWA